MVVNHVHYHAYSLFVHRVYEFLELLHALSSVVRVGGVASLWNVVVKRVVAPVEARFRVGLVHCLIVENRQKMDMRYSKRGNMIQPYRIAEPVGYALFTERPELPAELEISAFIGGKITHMQFINYCVCVTLKLHRAVVFPAIGIGAREIDHHSTDAVGASRTRVNIYRFEGFPRRCELICIEHAVQVPGDCSFPRVAAALHFAHAVGNSRTGVLIKLHRRLFCQRRPHAERRLRLRINRPQFPGVSVILIDKA